MRGIIDGRPDDLATPIFQPGRRLIRTKLSVRRHSVDKSSKLVKIYRLIMARTHVVRVTLSHDGLWETIKRGQHMLRRETGDPGNLCASFVGNAVSPGPDGQYEAGERVAGISITHPAHTEFVIARPEHVFPLPDHVPDHVGAIVLFGGLSVFAVDKARAEASDSIGLYGDDLTAGVVASLLDSQGVPYTRHQPGADAKIWIASVAAPSPVRIEADLVIGVGLTKKRLEADWPLAQAHLALAPDELAKSPDRHVDLYYYDSPGEWPDWFLPELFERFLQLAAERKIDIPEPDSVPLLGEQGTNAAAGPKLFKGFSFIGFTGDAGTETPPKPLQLRSVSPTKPVKYVSLVGSGRWPLGMSIRQLVQNENIRLRMVCDRRPEVMHLACRSFPFEYATTDYQDILSDDKTDLIVVAPYHGAHAPLATLALKAGKHCFVEKPPGVDHQQLNELMTAAQESDRMLHVGYNRRFAPAALQLFAELQKIEGPTNINMVVRSVDIPRSSWYYWPSNGSRVISNICHFTDFAMMLTGDARPIEVSASPSLKGRADQNVAVSVKFEDGSLASILYTDKGQSVAGYDQRYQVMKGDITGFIENFTDLRIMKGGRVISRWRGVEDMGHRGQMRAVANALVGDGPWPVPLEVEAVSAQIYLAAARSAETGGPVRISSAC